MDGAENVFLKAADINKEFPGVKALKNVSFEVLKGEILALVGENGAGKSTLMKILCGEVHADSGSISIEGEIVKISDIQTSQKLGISIIYQELNSVENITVAANIFLSREKRKGPFFDRASTESEAKKLLDVVGLKVDSGTIMGTLSTAQKQMVEVAKALSIESKLIIMDEPTSSLTENETNRLFEIIHKLKDQGKTIIFISHRLNEVIELADRVMVMRDGELVSILNDKSDINEDTIIKLMVGREIKTIFVKKKVELGGIALEVRGLSTAGFLKDISFSVRKGEILGFAGLVGAGRSEVMRALFGIDKRTGGQIFIDGEQVNIASAPDALRYGIGFLPEDRKEQALILGMTVRENTTLSALKRFRKRLIVDKRKEASATDVYIERLDIKTPGREQTVMNLSGGNQQKVVIGKWLITQPKILILDEPTRGIDVKSKKEIHALMTELAEQGLAIIMISSEMQEVLAMSDRIIVMHEGRITTEIEAGQATQQKIMKYAVS